MITVGRLRRKKLSQFARDDYHLRPMTKLWPITYEKSKPKLSSKSPFLCWAKQVSILSVSVSAPPFTAQIDTCNHIQRLNLMSMSISAAKYLCFLFKIVNLKRFVLFRDLLIWLLLTWTSVYLTSATANLILSPPQELQSFGFLLIWPISIHWRYKS